ncbi:LPXTG cell wall anchor domain-containing protein [Enterococcus hirae]|uniref:MucBP domain-containing protein n=3 Tax=Enterococcus TaxID=1350 RepID=UPI0013735CC2|nr:MucBP domain-containing protein [Enterococcus hirae]NBA21408.1 LPXTG cell wall anchor domain-containing protein [Enterococcus hirae]NBA27914.1 LPXTG cell wall anchor domain-containing protein [Enterococcus hirae]NBA34587.1 LPXTG cell wall anchor domain-containing protein [Enterococcus hirae]NBA37063.1 LPXTG cell wall anchor domain-containing protein [Enterococcus hirae]NBA42619.1 LPXTG cell wall anchor domain-containing protein [Enterococcus hirae]
MTKRKQNKKIKKMKTIMNSALLMTTVVGLLAPNVLAASNAVSEIEMIDEVQPPHDSGTLDLSMPEPEIGWVSVNGVDVDTQKVLWFSEEVGFVGNDVTLFAEIVEGYELISPDRVTIYMETAEMHHNFYYKKIEDSPEESFSSVTVQYLHNETGQPIAEPTVINDLEIGTEYIGNALMIDGYTIVGPETYTINVSEDPNSNIITFRYDENPVTKEKAAVTVKYINEKGESIAEDKIISDLEVGSTHTEEALLIEGYELLSTKVQTIEIQSEGNIITFIYETKETTPPENEKANLTVKYIDEHGQSIANDKIIQDLEVGSTYTEEALLIEGYELLSAKVQTIEVQSDGNTITFIYKAKETSPSENEKADLTVRYIDEQGQSIAEKKVITDLEIGKLHKEEALLIKGYELVNPKLAIQEVMIEKGTNTITFIYKKIKTTVALAGNVAFIYGTEGKQMTAVIPGGTTMYVVLNGEIIGKAKQEKVNSSRLVDVKVEEATTIYLSKAVANGETVQYYTENEAGEKSVISEITRQEKTDQTNKPTENDDNKQDQSKVDTTTETNKNKESTEKKESNQTSTSKNGSTTKNNSTGTTKTTVSGKATLPKTGEQQNRLLRSLGMALLVTVMGISYILKRKNRIKQDQKSFNEK